MNLWAWPPTPLPAVSKPLGRGLSCQPWDVLPPNGSHLSQSGLSLRLSGSRQAKMTTDVSMRTGEADRQPAAPLHPPTLTRVFSGLSIGTFSLLNII